MTGISFNHIPPNARVPLFYAETDNSMASYFSRLNKGMLIGQKLSIGTAETAKPILVNSPSEARDLFGRGSMLERMYQVYYLVYPDSQMWCIPLDENGAGAAATGTLTVTGTATANGTLTVYIAGQKVQAAVASGATAVAVATALEAAVNAIPDLPVAASRAAGVVTFTCKWKGETGNDVTIRPNFHGNIASERIPAGLSLVVVDMSAGTANPDIAPALAAMGDEEYDYIAMPFADVTNLDKMQVEMGEASGRWSYSRQVYGHAWTAKRGSVASLQAFGVTRNDPHMTVVGVEPGLMAPIWEVAASYTARNARYLDIDPARPTQTGILTGVTPSRPGERFTHKDRQALLFSGIATTYTTTSGVHVERSITTYQKNQFGDPDPSYLDVETMATTAHVIRFIRSRITQKYPRHKVANDGTKFASGQAIVTPKLIKAEIIAASRELEAKGILENVDVMKKHLIVERDTDPNRVNVLFPPDYVNQLRVFALLNQFRLQYT